MPPRFDVQEHLTDSQDELTLLTRLALTEHVAHAAQHVGFRHPPAGGLDRRRRARADVSSSLSRRSSAAAWALQSTAVSAGPPAV